MARALRGREGEGKRDKDTCLFRYIDNRLRNRHQTLFESPQNSFSAQFKVITIKSIYSPKQDYTFLEPLSEERELLIKGEP